MSQELQVGFFKTVFLRPDSVLTFCGGNLSQINPHVLHLEISFGFGVQSLPFVHLY